MERAEFYSALYDSNNYLEHHGVDGQKWGKRNGPPYPLNSEGKASLVKQRKAEKLNTENKLKYEQYKYAGRANTAYNVKVAGRVAAPIGGVIGAGIGSTIGPEGTVLGTIAGLAIADLGASATSGIINLGMNAVRNSKYKKALIESQKRTNENLIDDQKRINADKTAAQYKRNTEVVEKYTKSASESIKNGDVKKAAYIIAQIPYAHYESETDRLVSEGKTYEEACALVFSDKTKNGIDATERLAFNSAEKLLSGIKDPKHREEFLSELSITMDSSERDNPSVMVYNNNQKKITSYYDAYTVSNELEKNGLKATEEFNATDLDTIYGSKQRGTNSYYVWGQKVQ